MQFRFYAGPYLNTENDLVRHVFLAVMSYFGEFKRELAHERTVAGPRDARERERVGGKPRRSLRRQARSRADFGRCLANRRSPIARGGRPPVDRPQIRTQSGLSDAAFLVQECDIVGHGYNRYNVCVEGVVSTAVVSRQSRRVMKETPPNTAMPPTCINSRSVSIWAAQPRVLGGLMIG